MKQVWFLLLYGMVLSSLLLHPADSFGASGKKHTKVRTPHGEETGRTTSVRDPGYPSALFKEGVSALGKGDAVHAALLLDGLEEAYPALGDYILYYRIRAALKMGKPSEAFTLAGRLLERYPESVLVPRTRMEIVRALISWKQFPAARGVAEGILKQEERSETRRRVFLLLGEALEGVKDWQGAQDVYQRLTFENPVTPEGRDAEERMAGIMKTRGVAPEIPSDDLYFARVQALNRSLRYDRVIEVCSTFEKRYPESPLLEQALLLKARALIKTESPDQGIHLYEKLIRSKGAGTVQAEAAYHLGSYYWNQDRDSEAKRIFKRLIRAYSAGEWGMMARYALGRIYENDGDDSEAVDYFLTSGEVNADHPLAAEGAWRAGWVEYKAGKYEKARDIFLSCMRNYPRSDLFPAALYWQGKCEEKLSNAEQGQQIFRRLAEDYRWNFYGTMARKRLESSWNLVPDTAASSDQEDQAWYPEPIRPAPGSPLAFHLDRAEELIRIGYLDESGEEIAAVQKQVSQNPADLCYVAVLYERAGNFPKSLRWVLKSKACGSEGQVNIACMKRFLYPLAFWDTVQRETRKNNLDPFFVLAVMRQESLFQPDIVSPADARGLMQIIPSTGRVIARNLGIKDFTPENLYDPETNIIMGIRYLTDLKDRSNGDLVRVLCSYNAGESRSDQWWDLYQQLDADERIESITFRETRDYVKRVLNNMEIYRRLYEPSAPHVGKDSSNP